MDAFTFMIAIVVIMLALQFNQTWLVFGALGIMILSMRSYKAILLIMIAAVVLYYLRDSLQEYSIFILFGLVILALVLGLGKGGSQPEMLGADPYGGLMGGGAGY